MGDKNRARLGSQPEIRRTIAILIPFLVSAFLVYSSADSGNAAVSSKKVVLDEYFREIGVWDGAEIPVEPEIIESLELDDYLNKNYQNQSQNVSLYIGFYNSLKKTSVVHSPLVCFPGQGWLISQETEDTLRLNLPVASNPIVTGRSMVVTKGNNEQLIFFWYQAHEKTWPDTFRQKMSVLWNKYTRKKEDNALVRISVPISGGRMDEARKVLESFFQAFYPKWRGYLQS